jgi:anti-sigma factor (TIGR02949 family)
MIDDRDIAGLTCSQVLDRLSDYLDDDLAPDGRAQVEAHLRGCDRCLRFGGAIGAMVDALRRAATDEIPAGAAARLDARLADE